MTFIAATHFLTDYGPASDCHSAALAVLEMLATLAPSYSPQAGAAA